MCRRWSVRIQYRSIRKSLNFLDPICLHDKISQKSVQIHEIMMNAVGGIRTWARTCAITCTDHCTNKRRKKLARRRICSILTVVLQCQGDSSQDFITPQEFVWQIHILILYGRSTYNFVRGIHIQILYGKITYKKSPLHQHRTADLVPPTNFPGFRFVAWVKMAVFRSIRARGLRCRRKSAAQMHHFHHSNPVICTHSSLYSTVFE